MVLWKITGLSINMKVTVEKIYCDSCKEEIKESFGHIAFHFKGMVGDRMYSDICKDCICKLRKALKQFDVNIKI